MPPPSYPHRHLLLETLLNDQPKPNVPDAFALAEYDLNHPSPENNLQGVKLDILLLRGWTKSSKSGDGSCDVDRDVLQHAENLRLKTTDFDVLGRIGEGQFGVVDAVRSRLDGKVYAMKTIEKTMAIRAGPQLSLPLERHIHLLSHHESKPVPVPQMITAFQTLTSLHLLTTYAPCGTLWDRMCDLNNDDNFGTLRSRKGNQSCNVGRMTEEEVRWWGVQMVSAISWLHQKGFAHRDVKPHNFLLFPDSRLMLTDFGSSAPLITPPGLSITSTKPAYLLKRYCLLPSGTPDYVAPEILTFAEEAMISAAQSMEQEYQDRHKTIRQSDITVTKAGPDKGDEIGYEASVDWWSLGVTFYEMMYGRAPFFAPSIGETYEKITRCQDSLRFPTTLSSSSIFVDLIQKLLVPSENRIGRLGSWHIQEHPFFGEIRWDNLHSMKPPSNMSTPEVIDLSTLADSFDQSNTIGQTGNEFTFDHFFQSSPGLSSSTRSSNSNQSTPPQTSQNLPKPNDTNNEPWSKWVGWSWYPQPDFFGSDSPVISPTTPGPRKSSLPDAIFRYTTPLRPTSQIRPNGPPTSLPRTAPRSVNRTRPVSERQAFNELVRCVQMSARKRLSSGGKFGSGLGLAHSSGADGFGKSRRISDQGSTRRQVPPTPTPRSKEVTLSTTGIGITSLLSTRPIRAHTEVSKLSSGQIHIAPEGGQKSIAEMESWHRDLDKNIENLGERLDTMMNDMTR